MSSRILSMVSFFSLLANAKPLRTILFLNNPDWHSQCMAACIWRQWRVCTLYSVWRIANSFMHRYVWPTATTATLADTTTVHVALNRIIPFEIFPSYLFIVCILNLAVFMLHPKSRQVTWIDFDCKMHLFNRFYCIFTTHRAKKTFHTICGNWTKTERVHSQNSLSQRNEMH